LQNEASAPRFPRAYTSRTQLISTIGLAAVAATGWPTALATPQPQPTPVGAGARFHPPPGANGVPGLTCSRSPGARFGVHLELFARRLVVLVPAGIGVAPPRRRQGAYVTGGRCSYPARTTEPTGVIEVARGGRLKLGQFFDLWGQPLSPRRLAGFRGPPGQRLLAFVDGKPWRGHPRAIPLRRHAEIVLEIGGFVPPHVSYRFAKGL
jgi:hypothetical protein